MVLTAPRSAEHVFGLSPNARSVSDFFSKPYVGHTRNVPKRFDTHLRGDGSSHTKRHLPEKIVYVETFESEAEAVKRERQIKKWSRAKKEALISGDMAGLRELSRKRSE